MHNTTLVCDSNQALTIKTHTGFIYLNYHVLFAKEPHKNEALL